MIMIMIMIVIIIIIIIINIIIVIISATYYLISYLVTIHCLALFIDLTNCVFASHFLRDHNKNKALTYFVLSLPFSFYYQLCAINIFLVIDSYCTIMLIYLFWLKKNILLLFLISHC